MIRYISAFSERDKHHVKEMDGAYVIDKGIPDVPHYVLDVRIIRFEPNYDGTTRSRASFITRLGRAFKGAWQVFMEEYCA